MAADGRTCSGKTADTFEDGVGDAWISAGYKKRDCPEKAHKNPATGYNYVSLAGIDFEI